VVKYVGPILRCHSVDMHVSAQRMNSLISLTFLSCNLNFDLTTLKT